MSDFVYDEPIVSSKQDRLGLKSFAKQISKAIVELDKNDGICIGINGKWGSGKTSIINMIVEDIRNKDDNKHVILQFNPWNYSNEKELVNQFFIMMANGLSETKKEAFINVSKFVLDYVDAIEQVDSIKGKSILFAARKLLSLFSSNAVLSANDISKQKDILVEALKSQDNKIIIVIDDIDRLPNNQIRLIFQMVSSFAKFPNVIYLLSFDIEIVARALAEVQNCNGYEYLEKIIQIPIRIPEVRRKYINDLLLERLELITKQYSFIIDEKYWNDLYYRYVEGRIETIRDINRTTNTITAKCMIIHNEVDFVDLFMISFIENKYPDLYEWIRSNKAVLLGTFQSFQLNEYSRSSKEEHKKSIIDQMTILDKEKAQYYFDMLCTLFPVLASATREASTYDSDKMYRNKNIGHPDCFDRYFCLDLDEGEIPKALIDNALLKSNKNELIAFLDSINDSDHIIYVLDEIKAAIPILEFDRLKLIVIILIIKGASFIGYKNTILMPILSSEYSEILIEEILEKISDQSENYLILKELLITSDSNSIQILAGVLNTIEIAYGRTESKNSIDERKQFVTEQQLEECEKLYCDAFVRNAKCSDIFDYRNARIVLYVYKCFDKAGYDAYLKRTINNDLSRLRFIQLYAGNAYDSNGRSWGFGKSYLDDVSTEQVIESFERCVKDKTIWDLSEETIRKVIAFEIWVKTGMSDFGGVIEAQIDDRIKELKEQ